MDNTDKRQGRLNCIAHLLDHIPYETSETEPVELPDRDKGKAYDDRATMRDRRYVPERF